MYFDYFETGRIGVLTLVADEEGLRHIDFQKEKNPIPIIIPCHRVIGSDGSLTGFGGGLETKRRLIELEHACNGNPSQKTFRTHLAKS